MDTYLEYYIFDDVDCLTSLFRVSIKILVNEEPVEVGSITGALINSWCVLSEKDELAYRLDEFDNVSCDFGYFYYNLLDGKFDDKTKLGKHLELEKVIWIYKFEISDKYRNKGIGAESMSTFVNHCTNFFGSSCIFLYPYPIGRKRGIYVDDEKFQKELDGLICFYNKVGFKKMEAPFETYSTPLMYMLT